MKVLYRRVAGIHRVGGAGAGHSTLPRPAPDPAARLRSFSQNGVAGGAGARPRSAGWHGAVQQESDTVSSLLGKLGFGKSLQTKFL